MNLRFPAEGGLNLEVEPARLRHAGGIVLEIEIYLDTTHRKFFTTHTIT